ncbi:unnamed protein product [Clonostachys solani]|uniref:ARID domain-containing protein n=1 Tax=Clonostachys solani TaxID=160281 RepID=A0A9N9YWW3_9HYPO|nr:unnamed protein product [Clonostachys solani]
MSTWMNDAVPNHNGNGFPHMNDPNSAGAMMDPSAFMANAGQFNPAQFQNQQQPQQPQQNPSQHQMQAMQNGPMRNASPSSYQNPVYQTNSVIPSKRPRPRDESMAGSPTQNPGMLPTSRSQTPQQQSFAGYQTGQIPQQGPGQYSHLQANGSANASPSPIMGNQMRPGSVPQRVATASPHPFSPGTQQFTAQASPVTSEHVGTPQQNPYMQNMPQGYSPSFAPSPSNTRPPSNPNPMATSQLMSQQMGQMPPQGGQMGNSMYQMQQQQPQQHPQQQHPQQQQQQQMQQQSQQSQQQQKMAAYQMRLQQQLQGNMQMQAQMQAQQMGRGMIPKQQPPMMQNGQPPQPQGGMMRPRQMTNPNPENFMKSLTHLMNMKGLPLDPNPMIGDRPVNLVTLFSHVQNKGGYKPVTAANGWPYIAQALGLPAQLPTVGPALKQVYERNLLKFEEAWMAQAKSRMIQHPQQGAPQKPMQPNQQMNQGQMQPGQQQPQQQQTPSKPGSLSMNGFQTPQQTQQQPPPNAVASHNRGSMSTPIEAQVQGEFVAPSPVHSKSGSISMNPAEGRPPLSVAPPEVGMPRIRPKSDEYTPCSRELTTYGGVDIGGTNSLAMELARWEPDQPPLVEMGNIDIQALTRSLQSGIHGEVRLALDTLVAVSNTTHPHLVLQLRFCEDLVETLLDFAEEQLEFLAEHTVEVSDEILLTPYEDLVRSCRLEQLNVKESPVFGSQEYELDRAVDRLICISTFLRNTSFPAENNENHVVLADESVVKFLGVIIRYLGTRTMLLRTHANTLDFMKDMVILLSNLASSIELPSKEQALCFLQFLLAFAPSPGPTTIKGAWSYSPYEPSLHPYLPHAVDALAKLFARDEPNRTHYKTLFATDATNTPPFELLNRTFALAVSPIPDKLHEQKRPQNYPSLVETRKPYLMQGLLSAEIIASLAPGPEAGVTKAWLLSENDLAQNLLGLVERLSRQYEQPGAFRGATRAPPRKDAELVYLAVTAVSVLRRLAEKARDDGDSFSSILTALLPSSQSLLESLSLPSPEWTKEGFLHHLTACYNLSW